MLYPFEIFLAVMIGLSGLSLLLGIFGVVLEFDHWLPFVLMGLGFIGILVFCVWAGNVYWELRPDGVPG